MSFSSSPLSVGVVMPDSGSVRISSASGCCTSGGSCWGQSVLVLEPGSRSGQMYSVSRCSRAAGASVLLSLLEVC